MSKNGSDSNDNNGSNDSSGYEKLRFMKEMLEREILGSDKVIKEIANKDKDFVFLKAYFLGRYDCAVGLKIRVELMDFDVDKDIGI